MTKRTDIHRPGIIIPEDYEYVGIEYMKVVDIGDTFFLAAERERLNAHMKATGGKFSGHDHGGNCHICGAWAIYTARFYHAATNVYIRTGFDCADKLHMGADFNALKAVKNEIKNWKALKAGKTKALGILTEAGIEDAFAIYSEGFPTEDLESARVRKSAEWKVATITDIVEKLVKWGDISEKALNFLGKLTKEMGEIAWTDAETVKADAAEAKVLAKLPDLPEGRYEIEGEILGTKYVESDYGGTLKILVRDDAGYKYWGTRASAIWEAEKGDRVNFTAKVTRSDDDRLFGWFNRPTCAVIINKVEEAA